MTYLIRRNPVRDMVAMQRAFDRMFDEPFFRTFGWPVEADRANISPLSLDLYETEGALVAEATLPGIDPANVDISVQQNVLTIKADLAPEKEAENANYHLRERRLFTAVERTISLPVEINAEAAEATFKNGVLHLVLPKLEEVKPKRIEIKSK